MKPDIEITEQWVRSELRVSEETEGIKPVIYGDDNNVRGLIDPMLKRPVSGITVDITCSPSILTHATISNKRLKLTASVNIEKDWHCEEVALAPVH